METYKTYQEAKIANPESEIVTTGPDWDGEAELKWKFEAFDGSECGGHYIGSAGWIKCKPSTYCMTVEHFLKAGHRFVEGDVILRHDGEVITADEKISWNDWNILEDGDDERHILRAAALEKPKRVKVEFEKLEFTHAWEAVKESESGAMLFRDCHKNLERDGPRYMQVVYLHDVVVNWKDDNLYRKVERPIAWHEDAIEFAQQCKGVNTAVYIPEYDAIDIDGSMTREEACDYARILLEQEGE